MADDNPALLDLVGLLGTVHRELQRKEVLDRAGAGPTSDSHVLTCRLIAQQELRTVGDVRLTLRAADLARDFDPELQGDEPGAALDLLKRAVAAIDRIHAEQRQHANDMLAAIRKPTEMP